MALVQFRRDPNPSISKQMFAPKKATMEAWLRQARKTIKEIPKPGDDGWVLVDEHADLVSIRFELAHKEHGKAYVLIDRTAPSFG